MKKLSLIITVFLISTLTSSISYAQESVNNCILYAKRLQRNINERNFKNFKDNYSQALKDISDIESKAATNKFGYDEIADNADGWINLNQILNDFTGSIISYKGENIHLEIKDYVPIFKQAKENASKGHFDEAINIIQASKIYENRLRAIPHLDKAKKYAEKYTEQVKDNKALIYYEEGLRLYNQKTDFELRVESVPLFEKALEQKDPYKDTRSLLAKLYSDEADLISESNDLKNLRKTISYYDKALLYVSDYEGVNGKKLLTKQKGASILYKQALNKEKEQSFIAQSQAANLYNEAIQWMNGYKDAADRAIIAEKNSTLKVVFLDDNGNIISSNTTTNNITSKTNKYIIKPKISNSSIDLQNTSNYKELANELGSGFILIKLNTDEINYSYKGINTQTDSLKIDKFFLFKRNISTGKTSEKEISEQEYKEGLKELKASRSSSGSKFRVSYKTYKGTFYTTTKTASVENTYPLEIWDIRNPDHPIKIKSIINSDIIRDRKIRTTYSGSMKIKPELTNEGNVKGQDELMSEAKSKKPTIFSALSNKENEIIETLNQIKYIHQ